MNYSKRNNNVCTCCNRVTARLKHNYIAGPMKYQRVKGGRCSLLTLLAIMSTKLRIIPVIMAHTWYVTVSSTSQRIPFPENELRLIPSLREDTVTILNICIYILDHYWYYVMCDLWKAFFQVIAIEVRYPFVVESEYGGMQWTIS